MIKKRLVSLILILCLICLAGCGGETPDAPEAAMPSQPVPPPASLEQTDSVLTRSDAEGFVTVRIEDGRAELTYDLEKWDSLCGIFQAYEEAGYENVNLMYEGPYEIEFHSDLGCIDACPGFVPGLETDFNGLNHISILFLMEDGTVEYMAVVPYPWDFKAGTYYSYGKLPWVKDIASLSFESMNEGLGEMTLYARDKNGLTCDVRDFYPLLYIFDCEWVYDIGQTDDDDTECLVFSFADDGTLLMEKKLFYKDAVIASYKGVYSVTGAISGGKPVLALELYEEWENQLAFQSEYFFEADNERFTLYLAEGDALYSLGDGTPVTVYPLRADWSHSLEPYGEYEEQGALLDFLFSYMPSLAERVHEYGFDILVTDETVDLTDIDGGYCRLVALGTDHPDHFVREELYAVSHYDKVYGYDTAADLWWYIVPAWEID